MKFYITMFNNCVVLTMVLIIYYLNTVDENDLNKKYDIGTYVF